MLSLVWGGKRKGGQAGGAGGAGGGRQGKGDRGWGCWRCSKKSKKQQHQGGAEGAGRRKQGLKRGRARGWEMNAKNGDCMGSYTRLSLVSLGGCKAGVPWNSSKLVMVDRTFAESKVRSDVAPLLLLARCWHFGCKKGKAKRLWLILTDKLFLARSRYNHDGQCIDAVHDLPASWSKCSGVRQAGKARGGTRRILRMCTMPMYEVLEDRSVRRFSICLAISFLVSMGASIMQNMQACLTSSFTSCQALPLSFSSLPRSALWD